MKQLFYIDQRIKSETGNVLSIQLGEKHAAFAITDRSGDILYELGYCVCEKDNEQIDQTRLESFLRKYPSLSGSFTEINICFDHLSAELQPFELVDSVEIQSSHETTELLPGWKLYSHFSIPIEIGEVLQQKFPSAKKKHTYRVLLDMIPDHSEEATILLDFRKDDFSLVAVNGKNLLVARSFEYTVPADAIFYLIKTCRVFSLTQEEVPVLVCGLIDRQSSLFSEIFQYFRNVGFKEASWSNDTGHPKHFFTCLNEIARCAS